MSNDNTTDAPGGLRDATCSPEYFAGMTCQCGAYNENECGCPDVDWTPTEVYKLRALLTALCDACDGIDCVDFMPTGMPEAYEAARNYLQENAKHIHPEPTPQDHE